MTENKPSAARAPILDVGIGDPEAPANAIPNIIAQLVETETWRNAATVLMGVLLIGLGYWSYNGVRNSIAETQVVSLEALLQTVVQGIEVWVAEHRAESMQLAGQPDVAAPAMRLAEAAHRLPDTKTLCRSPDATELARTFRSVQGINGAVAYLVVDRTGLVIASENPASCGQRVRSAAFRFRLDRALDGTAQFVRPHPDPELSIESASGGRRPVAWFLAPIRSAPGPAVVALALGIVADRDLVAAFTAARSGTATEAYAFGDDGLMLTPTRFAEELAAAGVLRDIASESLAFRLPVRDPGGDLTAGYAPQLEPAARPLTRAAALAIAARNKSLSEDLRGGLSEPYRSYRGDDVLGAWRWLPALDMGVIVENTAADAYKTLRYLLISFAIIGAFTVIMVAAAFQSGFTIHRLQRQFGRLQRLGAYTLERQISEGGMATVYLARHALLKRPTAIKILKKHVATDEFVHRFEREVQIASQLLHPNTVRIYDFGRTREGQPYYVMEYLDGVTLAELVAHSGPVPAGRVVHILRQVGAALREAHECGLIHRDV